MTSIAVQKIRPLDFVQEKVLKGEYFTTTQYGEIANSDQLVTTVIVATGYILHVRPNFIAPLGGHVEIYEDTTFSATGTTQIPRNRNRFSSIVSEGVTVRTGDTVDSAGVIIDEFAIPNTNRFGTGDRELVLTAGSYTFIITNAQEDTVQPASINIDFYEVKI